ncbi:mucin-2 isoform X11 [Tympanuchus pallidicinctus]|uniref:mucin-2 isoform X11 n=1 Tax=Tympanuchus pallidicinctus TaxID=109042 RepID=UPI0022871C8A|nr:mucin-2 isoform X11 [Tympanuchus pallidicinctus]
MEGDDFKTTSGLVEATGSAFANTWKAQSTCADQEEKLEDPCSLSIESANYAEHWCSLLKNSEGPFASCHSVIDPAEYYKRCKYDTCLCKDSEECLCAALSSYSRACAFKGIILGGWRQSVCSAEVSSCPGNQVFLYNLTMCQQTCRSIADGEKYCLQDFAPVDGCGCPDNTYLDNEDTCVPISKCPCYYKGSYLEPGDYVIKDGERCVCRNAKVQCTSVTMTMKSVTECSSNKTYFDCNTSPDWTSQTPVQLRCGASQTDLYQSECVSGCVCPEGLFDDGRGGCVVEEDCPCIHNSDWYNHGQSISVDCNTCTCQKGIWSCTENVCYGTCMIYGSGHYITFDGKFYDFDGSCEYVATQDYCGDKNSGGSFSIITENVPCGTTGVTCSKAIKMFIGKTELKLENKDYKEIQRDVGDDVYYQNKTVGLYLVIEASNGVMLIWDKKTTVFIKLTPDYKGKVCGLCGNFDDKSNNDFTSRSGLQETSALEFGNSWKQSSVCPDVTEEIKPCDLKPHRKSWAEKECSLILSEIFKICHSKVNPSPFYDACVHDACSCDSGGDCDCFCSAVAAYAQECTKAQACVFWRSPDICPIFCDYYNPRNECEWHYEPCGSNVMTCRMIYNVSTNFSVPYLEGCYPRCPHEKPIYNEETKECVAADECWCYHNGNPVIIGGEIPTEENCTKCICRPSGSIECSPIPGCPCVINGTSYDVGETVATIKDGDICTIYVCAENGSVIPGGSYPCPLTTSPSTITTSPGTSTITTIVTTSPPVTTTPCLGLICDWSEWFDVSNPEEDGGDYETYEEIRKEHGNKICTAPENIECRAKDSPDKTLEELGQKVECNVTYGLICKNEEQDASIWHLCYNYEIRVNCCEWHEIPCGTASTPSSTPTASSVTTGTTVPTTTTRQSTTITTTPTPTATTTSQPTSSVTTPVTSASTVSTAAPTPTPSESPTSTATTTPFSSSTQGTTTTVPGVSSSTPTVTSTVPPTIVTQTHSPPPSLPVTNCECIWTDWIDSSQPDRSDVNSGDYEIIDKINNSSLVCVKAENITCRAKDYPNISLEELGQKVECSVNTGLICNNKDQENNSNISYCHNYEISICCTPNKPECIPTPEYTTAISTTVSHSTTTTIVFTSTVSSTTAPPTPTESAPTTTSGTTLSSSTASSTVSTTPITSSSTSGPTSVSTSTPRPTPTTSLTPPPTTTQGPTSQSTTSTVVSSTTAPPTPTTSAPTTTSGTTLSSSTASSTVSTTPITSSSTSGPTSVSTSTPRPTPTTSLTPPPTTTEVDCTVPEDCIWTDWIDVSYPQYGPGNGDDETFETIQNKIPSWNCTKAENISCRAEKFPDTPIEDLGQKVECDVNTGLICKNDDQTAGGVIPMPVCLNYQIKVCCTPPLRPECTTAITTTTRGETSTTVSLSPTTSTIYTPSVSSTTAPPTPTTSAPTTTSGTTLSSSTASSTVSTTPITSSPTSGPTSVSTSTPRPTPTTSLTPPPTTTEGPTSQSTTSTSVSSTSVSSSSAPPTPTTSAPTTTSGTTLSSSTASSTVSTTPVTSSSTSGPTSVSTSTPRPTPTTSLTPPPTTTQGPTSQSTTSTVVSSTTAPPTPTTSAPTTTSGTTLSSSTASSTVSTTPITSSSTSGPTSVSTSTPRPTPTTSLTPPPTTTEVDCTVPEDCIWTDWIDVSYPQYGPGNGDDETFETIQNKIPSWNCTKAENISCRAEKFPDTPIEDLGQKVECDVNTGLICKNDDQTAGGVIPMPVCLNYQIKVCCTPPLRPECTTAITTTTRGETSTTVSLSPTTSTIYTPSVSSTTAPPTPTTSAPTTTSGTTLSSSTASSTVSTTPITSSPTSGPTSVSTSTPRPTPTTSLTPPPTTTEGPTSQSTTSTSVSSSSAPPTPTTSAPTTTSGTTLSSSTASSTVSTTPVTSSSTSGPTSVSTSTPRPTPTTSLTPPPTTTQGPTSQSTTSTVVSSTTAPPTPTTSAPTTTSGTTLSSSTASSTVSTTPITSSSTSGPTSVSTSTPRPTPTTSLTPPPTTTEVDCTVPEDCIWTDWIDVSYPQYGPGNGDDETFETIQNKIPSWNCTKAENISCRAEKFPDTPIEDLGQKVECDVNTGLICKNDDQTAGGVIPMPVCLNYQIKVCCTPPLRPECTTAITTTTRGETSTTVSLSPTTSTIYTPSVSSTTAPPTPTTSAPTTTSGTTLSSSTASSTVSTTPITSSPTSGPTSVSTSTPRPTPTTSLTPPPTTTEGPTSQSTTSTSVSSSSAPPTPTTSAPTTTSGTTLSSSTASSTVSTTPITSSSTSGPTSVSTSTPRPTPTTSLTPPPTTTQGPTSQSTTSTVVSSTTAPPTPTTSAPTTTSGTTLSSSTASSTVSTTPITSSPTSGPTSVSTSTPRPTPTTSLTPPPTTTEVDCTVPEDCIWTDWIDVSYPQYGPGNGDDETFETIQNKIPSWNCTKAENISCRAEKFPDTPIEDLGQKVECDVNTGLICKNDDQTAGGVIPMPVCLNYQIKVCCTPPLRPECTTAITTTTRGETSTTVSLSPTTSTIYTPSVSSTTAPPTPTTSAPTTTSGTTLSSSTASSTVSTTPITSSPTSGPTSVSTSTPRPTPTTSLTPPPTTTEGPTSQSTTSTSVSSSSAPPTPTTSAPTTTSGTTLSSSTASSTVSTTPITSSSTSGPTSVSTSTPRPTPTTSLTPPPTTTQGPTSQSTTSTVVSSTTAPPTPTTSAPTTTSGTTLSSSTASSTVSTTPITSSPTSGPTSVSTSTPRPTPTTSLTPPPTTTEGPTSQSTTSTSVSSSSAPPTPTTSAPTTTSGTTLSSSTASSTVSTTPITSSSTSGPTSVSTSTPRPTPTTSLTPPPTTTQGPTSQSTTSTVVSSTTAPPTPTTSAPTTTSGTTLSSSTASSTVSTTPITSSSTSGPTSVSTSTPRPTPTTSLTPPPTTTEVDCTVPEDCIWTDWIDVSYPQYGPGNGDDETFETIQNKIPSWNCTKAENISCRAEKFPDTPIEDLGQKVECDVNTGLICKNDDQTAGGVIPMPVCLNYQIKVCCTPPLRPECTTAITTTTRGETSTTVSLSPTTSTIYTPSVSSTTAPPTPTTSAPTTTSGTTLSSSTASSTVSTTPITSSPTSGPTSVSTSTPRPTPTTSLTPPPTTTEGPTSQSTTSTSVSSSSAPPTPTTSAPTTTSGTTLSSSTASSTVSTTPITSSSTSGPTSVSTSTPRPTPTTSLTPPPTTTQGPTSQSTTSTVVSSTTAPPTPTTSAPTTTSGTTLSSSTASSTVSTTPITSSPTSGPTSVSTSTPRPTPTTSLTPPPTTTEGPTSQSTTSTSVSSSSAPPTPTTSAPTTTSGTTLSSSTASSTVSTTPITSSSTSGPTSVSTSTPRPTPTTSLTPPPTTTQGPTSQSTTSTVVSSTTAPPTPTTSAPTTTSGTTLSSSTASSTVSTTPITSSPTSGPTSVSTSTPRPTPTTSLTPPPTTTEVDCTVPEDCIWTDWIDVSYPQYGPGNGDDETFETIQNKIPSWDCTKAENISCRAEKFPDTPIEDLGQKVECDVNTGLICKNDDQTAGGVIPMPVCLNYQIKVCCTPPLRPECTTAITTTTRGETSTTVSLSPTTSTIYTPSVSSTTAPPTPTTSAPTTTSGTTLSSSTASSTVSTTPITSSPTSGPTSVSTSTPRPTPTTSLTPPPTTTEGTSSYSTTSSFSSEGTTTVSESSSTASVSTPISTQTTAASSPLLTPSGSMSPPSVSTVPSTVTTSGTTPTKPFTTTSGTTSSSSSTVTATSITTSEIVSSGSATTSGTTPISSTVSVSGSSTYSTVTTLSTLSSTTSASSNCTISPDESYAPGESWWLCNCTKAICVENNTVVIVPVICEPPPKPTCSNGLAPVQVIDDDQCCWHWECDCYCTGWGDPHYLTFDGLYYSYQGNCTYVLVEEIEKTVDNFGVYIDNYHCDAQDVVSCPRAIIVRHETQEVRIETVKPNTLEVEVTVNKQAVALPYKKFGLMIYESGINSVVEIPELKMNVTFNGLSFSIRMPYSLFGNNTQGQCGTCSNNTADDCRLPNGNIAENCETMADYWQVVDPSKPQCSPGLIPTKAPSTTTGQPCKESSLCELLWGSVFEKCHAVVKPDKYYAACVFDSCMLPDLDLECSSLQIYAAVCADQNVCIDWRSHTNGVCSYECSKHKEYRACGPIQETTCKSSTHNETSVKQVEGCFCPNGTMLYDSGVDVCVHTCGCVGLDLIPREFGEKFIVDCQDCVCLEGGNGIVCEPHTCPEQNIRNCSGKGFYEVTEVNSEDSCCPIVTCKCNTSLCTTEPLKCTQGFEVHSYIPSDECCPVYQCVPKNVCVHQNAEFLPNSSVFVDKCHDCFCTNEVNISTQLNVISCEHIPCNTYCEPGYELKQVEGECCGKCVQTKCIIHTSHGSSLILNPGEFTNDPYNNCTVYSCTNLQNQLIPSTSEIMCPAFSEESCKPGTITLLPNGCCKTCEPLDSPTPCFVREREDFIVYKNCRSLERVVLTECEGTCETFSLYSVEASSMEHSCSCCKEVETSMKEVELQCPSGKSITHKYVYVEKCGCQDTQCVVSESSESQSTEENDESSRSHRRRAISLTSK